MSDPTSKPSLAVAIPCHNEEATIAQVIKDFRQHLPTAAIFVFDNASTDRTAAIAAENGAQVIYVALKGKGNVMRSIFDHINADALIVIDGDGTYSAKDVDQLLQPVLKGRCDMVVGNRLLTSNEHAHFYLNRLGTRLIVTVLNSIFKTSFKDVLSGYRIFSRKFVKTVPLLTTGFETETEMTIQALEEGLAIEEIGISYQPRPVHSPSKLRPFSDGWRIMLTIAMLLRDHYPLRLYSALAGITWLGAIVSVWVGNHAPLFSSLLFFIGLLFWGIGFILNAINTRLREVKQILLRNTLR